MTEPKKKLKVNFSDLGDAMSKELEVNKKALKGPKKFGKGEAFEEVDPNEKDR